jgi:hypothetical protein
MSKGTSTAFDNATSFSPTHLTGTTPRNMMLIDLNNDGYLDYDPSDDDINLLHRLIHNAPKAIKNLQGITMSKQVELVNKLFDTFKYDITIALALLEKQKIDPNIILDEHTCLLLELSVRLEIVNNKYKIDKILGTENTTEKSENDIDLLF